MELDLTHYSPARAHLIERAYRLTDSNSLLDTISLGEVTAVFNALEAAKLLIGWQLDAVTVAAALIMPVVHAGLCEPDQLIEEIDETAVELARSTLDLAALNSRLARHPSYEQTPINMRELLLAETNDMRTLIIWLVTRLVALRLQPDRQLKRVIARRCREIYAPIADLLGMWQVKAELEEYGFEVTEPKRYHALAKALRRRHKQIDKFLARSKHELKRILTEAAVGEFEVAGRRKHLFSINKKLAKSDHLSNIYDLVALRVIVVRESDCYKVLSAIHADWEPLPHRIKDYIARPKPNGYRSIHTTVHGLKNELVEIQIRTQAMHVEAETGLAAHFYYDQHKMTKNYARGSNSAKSALPVGDIAQLHEVLQAREVVDPTRLKLELFTNNVYAFSPKGDVYALPAGATALDFAFAVHTDIGLRAKGVKVNGQIAKLERRLANRDVVEVITRKEPQPHADWLKIVKLAKAKSKIRSVLAN